MKIHTETELADLLTPFVNARFIEGRHRKSAITICHTGGSFMDADIRAVTDEGVEVNTGYTDELIEWAKVKAVIVARITSEGAHVGQATFDYEPLGRVSMPVSLDGCPNITEAANYARERGLV